MVGTRCPSGDDGSVAAACCTENEDATGLEHVGAAELLPGDSACRHSLSSGEGSLGSSECSLCIVEGSLGSSEDSLGIGEGSLGSGEDCDDCTEAPEAYHVCNKEALSLFYPHGKFKWAEIAVFIRLRIT